MLYLKAPSEYPVIVPTTALGLALVEFFDAVKEFYEDDTKGTFKVIVFGGCAVHVHTQARGSADIDAELDVGHLHREDVIAVLAGEETFTFLDDDGTYQQLELDGNFSNALGPLHEDYTDRLIRLHTEDATPYVQVYVASAIDVAISKLGRFGDRDIDDIVKLLSLPGESVEVFERLAKEAIDYYPCDSVRVIGNLNVALREYWESQP